MTVGLWRLSDFLAYFSNDVGLPSSHAHWHQQPQAGSTPSAALPQPKIMGGRKDRSFNEIDRN